MAHSINADSAGIIDGELGSPEILDAVRNRLESANIELEKDFYYEVPIDTCTIYNGKFYYDQHVLGDYRDDSKVGVSSLHTTTQMCGLLNEAIKISDGDSGRLCCEKVLNATSRSPEARYEEPGKYKILCSLYTLYNLGG